MVAAGVFGRAPPPGVERPPVASSCAALSLSPTLGVVRTPLALRAFVQPKGPHARFLRPGGAALSTSRSTPSETVSNESGRASQAADRATDQARGVTHNFLPEELAIRDVLLKRS